MRTIDEINSCVEADPASHSFSSDQKSILSRRATASPEHYVSWEKARDAILLRIANVPA